MNLIEGTVPWYKSMYAKMIFDEGYGTAIRRDTVRICNAHERYKLIEKRTGVPWFVVGCLHNMESSCDFRGVLHNGQHIIGTGRRTSIVPVGRGPFATWEEAAVDAITLNGSRWTKLRGGSLDVGEILYACERFNGTGYISGAGREDTSPYLWACTSVNDGRGKYVGDGEYDEDANSNGQVGVAAILKQMEMNNVIKLVV